MWRNLGTEERIARILLSFLLFWFFMVNDERWIYAWLALFFFLEFLFSYSVINTLLHRTTRKLPDPNVMWYRRFDWLTWLIGVPLVVFMLFIATILYLDEF